MIRGLVVLALSAAAVAVTAPGAAAATPAVHVDRSSVPVGERVMVIMEGFPAQRSVTITVCGNAARRGSIDCAVTRSQGYGVSGFDKVHATSFEIAAPPAPCPCVIQVSDATFTQVAYAPIDVVGHPTGAIVAGAVDAPLSVELAVKRSRQGVAGWLRSALGGPTTYAVTVVVRNRVGETLNDIKLTARAGRSGNDQARVVRFEGLRELTPNQAISRTQKVTVPAPGIGKVTWTVAASGAGPVTKQTATTNQRPLLLFVLLLVLVADVGWYGQRRLVRRSRRESNA